MPYDLLLDEDGDLQFNGDLVWGESTTQHQDLLLLSNKGDFKENPTAGVGISTWLKDEDEEGLLAEIKKEFQRDGMTVNRIEITKDKKLIIDAYY